MAAGVSGNRCLTHSTPSGTQILDFNSGRVKDLPGLGELSFLINLSKSGRYAGLFDLVNRRDFYVYDLDSMKISSVVDLGSPDFGDFFSLAENTALFAVGGHHIAGFDLRNPSTPPDTFWRGDATGEGKVFVEDNSALVCDGQMRLFWIDLNNGRETELGTIPGKGITASVFHSGLGLVAVAGWWDTIEVFQVNNGQKWTLPVPGEGQRFTQDLWLDPLGRWLISMHPDEFIAWNLPLDPLFGEPEYGEILESLRSLTNVRVVPNATKTTGFRITNTSDLQIRD